MKKIILDTNFLLAPYQFKVDIFTEINRIADFRYEIFVLDKTLDELKRINREQTGLNKDAARFALKMIGAKGIKSLKSEAGRNTDDSIVGIASKEEYIVATQDKILKKRLMDKGIAIIIIRQGKKLELLNKRYG